MKNKIITTLKNRYKNLGFGEKAFDGVADFMATTVTEEAAIGPANGGAEPMLFIAMDLPLPLKLFNS